MAQIASVRVTGQVRTTARVNLRRGEPSTTAPVLRKIEAQSVLAVRAVVVGQAVEDNVLWFETDEQAFVWSGGCTAVEPMVLAGPGAPPSAATPAPTPGPTPSAAVPGAPPAVPLVVDIYHGNRVTSFAQAYQAGVRGVIHKATHGMTGRDETYDDRRAAAVAAGMLWGAYHWGTAKPVRQQVDNFLAWAKPDAHTLVALDYELDPGNQMTLEGAREFLELMFQEIGRRPVLYSGHLIKDQLGTTADPFFGQHRLWLAQYGSRPTVQRSWSGYWLWQYSDGPASIAGIPGNAAGAVDRDHYPGTPERLAAEWAS